jgi:hypothetical protein
MVFKNVNKNRHLAALFLVRVPSNKGKRLGGQHPNVIRDTIGALNLPGIS